MSAPEAVATPVAVVEEVKTLPPLSLTFQLHGLVLHLSLSLSSTVPHFSSFPLFL
jgi:hypothetical protein